MERTATLEPTTQEQPFVAATLVDHEGEIANLEQLFESEPLNEPAQIQAAHNYIPRHTSPEIGWSERFRTSRLGKAAIGLATTVGLVGGGLALTASPAAADGGAVHHVYNTGGDGLWLHPDSPTIHSKVTDRMPDTTEFDVSCWK